MVNQDFLARSGLNSVDLRVERIAAWSVGIGAGAVSPKNLPHYAAAVIFAASAPVAISIEGQVIAANPTDGALSIPAGFTPLLGLELGADVTPFAFNAGAAILQVCMIVFVRKRLLEKLPGQV